MKYVIIAVDFASGAPCPIAGEFLRSMDFDAHDGRGDAVFTVDAALALHFASQAEALRYWRTTSAVRPLRSDGEANRPLTCTTVRIEPLCEPVKGTKTEEGDGD